MRIAYTLFAAWIALSVAAEADPLASPSEAPATTSPASADSYVLPALTPVQIAIDATVNSEANKIGDHLPIRLISPLALVDGKVIPAGITGSGDVVHAAKSRFGGKPGELILAVRYLDFEGVRIPLRSLTFPATPRAQDNQDTAFAVGLVSGVASLFITGGEVNVPAGTVAFAKTSAPVTLQLAPAKSNPSSTGESKP